MILPSITYTVPGTNPLQEAGSGIRGDGFTSQAATLHSTLGAFNSWLLELESLDWEEVNVVTRISTVFDRKRNNDLAPGSPSNDPRTDTTLVSGKTLARGYESVITATQQLYLES